MGGLSDAGPQQPENFAALIDMLDGVKLPDPEKVWINPSYSLTLLSTKIKFLRLRDEERTLDNLLALFEHKMFREVALGEPEKAMTCISEMYESLPEGKSSDSLIGLVLTDLFLTLTEANHNFAICVLGQMDLFSTTRVPGEEKTDCLDAFRGAAAQSRAGGGTQYRLATVYDSLLWALAERRRLRPEPVAEGAGESSQPAVGPSVVEASGSAPVSPAASSSTSAPDLASTSGATPVPAPAPTPASASASSPSP